MKHAATQTGILNTTTSSKRADYSSAKSDKSLKDKKVVQTEDIHYKAYNYLESLKEKYSKDLDILYEKAGSLMDIFLESSSFDAGIKKAREQYKIIQDSGKICRSTK